MRIIGFLRLGVRAPAVIRASPRDNRWSDLSCGREPEACGSISVGSGGYERVIIDAMIKMALPLVASKHRIETETPLAMQFECHEPRSHLRQFEDGYLPVDASLGSRRS